MQNFTPIEYMKIDLASNFGLDKETWDTRIEWTDTNEDILETLVEKAEEPAMFFAGLQAYRAAQQGKPIGYMISLDATASGAQILAALVGCKKSAAMCNMVDTGNREDFYTNAYNALCDSAGTASTITRGQAKDAIMPWFYGSKQEPEAVFGVDTPMLAAFYETMDTVAPGISKLRDALVALWNPDVLSHDWILPDNYHVKVKVKDSHSDNVVFLNRPYEVVTSVNRPTEFGLSNAANSVHSIDGYIVREMGRRCNYDKEMRLNVMELCAATPTHTPFCGREGTKQAKMTRTLLGHFQRTGMLSARILECINEETIHLLDTAERDALWQLLESMPKKPFKILSNHDCFRASPNYGNDMRRQYNQIMHEIAKSTLLEDIASQIVQTPVSAPKIGDISNDVLQANYALS